MQDLINWKEKKNRKSVNELMIGMLTENYVASSLKYNGVNLNYWKNE